MLAAILSGAGGGGGQAIEGGIAAAQGMAVQQQINFTRDNEYEADRVGIGFLAGAGFDPNGMGRFLRDHQPPRKGSRRPTSRRCCIDHPVTTDRIAEARGARGAVPAAQRRATRRATS